MTRQRGDLGADTSWGDAELLALMREHAPAGVEPESMLPMLRELVRSGADPRALVAAIGSARGQLPPSLPIQGAPGAAHWPVASPPAGPSPRGGDSAGGVAGGALGGAGASRKRQGWRARAGRAGAVVFWLLVWEVADRAVDNRLLLAGPIRTLQALAEQVVRPEFWAISGASLGRIVLGFVAAFVGGIVLALVAHRQRWFRELIAPVVSVVKTVPVVSFIIMLLIWLGGQALTSWLAFLIVVPLVYTSMLTGLGAVAVRDLERARVFRLSPVKQFWYLSRPSFMPFLTSACRVGVGMSWRAGIMAELFAATTQSIGKEMFTAKTFLDTPTLFAWTVVVMVLSVVFERAVMLGLRTLSRPFGGLLGRSS
ncbi:ABC transporter permease [Leucobacter albus]|uniref:ABC transporter permease n=1 Tax=Leucobacter albus TaxID=272210 RepID=A0ABW3TRI9_9MICO